MELISRIDPASLEGTPREIADSGIAQYGKVLYTWQAIMHKPEMFATYLPFLRQVAGPGQLDAVTKDLSALYVGYLNNCQYTVSHRAQSARNKGVSDEAMRDIVSENWADLETPLQLALELSKVLSLEPTTVTFGDEPQVASQELISQIKKHFSEEELLELTMSISMWNALARFHRVMGFELDMPIAPEGVNPQ